jgi:hypothetical protein
VASTTATVAFSVALRVAAQAGRVHLMRRFLASGLPVAPAAPSSPDTRIQERSHRSLLRLAELIDNAASRFQSPDEAGASDLFEPLPSFLERPPGIGPRRRRPDTRQIDGVLHTQRIPRHREWMYKVSSLSRSEGWRRYCHRDILMHRASKQTKTLNI